MHGSGTPVGDALEIQGLKMALTELGHKRKVCVVGSNKGNIGNAQVSHSIIIQETNGHDRSLHPYSTRPGSCLW